MSKSDVCETRWLTLLFNNTAFADVGDATGLRSSTTEGSLYLSLHTADPGEAGSQATNEVSYTGYARVAVPRNATGFTVSGNQVTLTSNRDFGLCTAGTATATYFAIGTSLSGAGVLLYKGAISPTISIANGVTPRLTTTTAVTED